jgi:predicted flap endonuclease-1-like 5' DNA nuclease
MTDLTAYRQRVTTVRGRARAQLAAIRKERLSRRKQVRYVADAVSLTTTMAAEPVEARDAAGAFAEADTATDVQIEACSAAAEDLLTGGDPTPELLDAVQTGTPEAADAAVDGPVADEPAAAVCAEAAPAEPEAVAGGADAAAAPDEAPAPDPDDGMTPDVPALPEFDSQDEDAASSGADEPASMVAPLPSANIAPVIGGVTAMTPASETEAPGATDPLPEPVAAAALPAAHPAEADAASDLFQIPGIGTGLVWMMQSAGIQCLDDLARAETRELEERLGMISRLLDLDYFVEFARTRDDRP